ncbi:MAG: 30S ribosomal protein S9 [Gemmataceae bacterium]
MIETRKKPKPLFKYGYYWGTGRRKTSVARVRIREGTGQIIINKTRSLEEYFTEDKDREAVMAPLVLCEMHKRLDIFVNVHGGGFTGQSGAICQGVARALKDMFSDEIASMPESEVPPPQLELAEGGEGEEDEPQEDPESNTPIGMVKRLRDSGYLTRDGRMKERKKYGRKGARKSFQFSKR